MNRIGLSWSMRIIIKVPIRPRFQISSSEALRARPVVRPYSCKSTSATHLVGGHGFPWDACRMGWGPEQRVQGFRDPVTQPPRYWLGMTSQEDIVSSVRTAFKGASISFAPSDSPLAHSVRHLCGRGVEGSGGSDEKTGFVLIDLHVGGSLAS